MKTDVLSTGYISLFINVEIDVFISVQLELALVDISPSGSKWLQDNISQKIIWFQPLSVSDSTVYANIFQWKVCFSNDTWNFSQYI